MSTTSLSYNRLDDNDKNDSLVTMTLCYSQVMLLTISRFSGVFTTGEEFEVADKEANLQENKQSSTWGTESKFGDVEFGNIVGQKTRYYVPLTQRSACMLNCLMNLHRHAYFKIIAV